ncbi:MAG: hypothetical protein ACKVT2_09160 [Saprospiraceae bacterium]
MKHFSLQVFICTCLLINCISPSLAQSEISVRPLFFQNDFTGQKGFVDGASQGQHAGEWQLGVSGRTYLSRHFAGRLETNLTYGRYPLSRVRFSYLGLSAIPEWHISPRFFIGSGAFLQTKIKDPFNTDQNLTAGLLANTGFRHGQFEIQCRFQRWLGSSGKFTLGAGFDYFFGLNKKTKVDSPKN